MSSIDDLTMWHEEFVSFLLEAEAIGLRPGRTAIADHLGLTEGKSRRVAERLLDLGILVTGGHDGSRGGYSVNRGNPWIVRRLVANRDARRAAALAETIDAEQLAALSMGCPVSREVPAERVEDVRRLLADVEPADERFGLWWVEDAYAALSGAFEPGWWTEPPPPPMHRRVLAVLNGAKRGPLRGSWVGQRTSLRAFGFARNGMAPELAMEYSLPGGAWLTALTRRTGGEGDRPAVTYLDAHRVRSESDYLGGVLHEVLARGG